NPGPNPPWKLKREQGGGDNWRHSTGRAGGAGKKDFSPHTKQACEQPDSIELPSI
ncbi:unnamed protein product, partial [marine sediment metagenome]